MDINTQWRKIRNRILTASFFIVPMSFIAGYSMNDFHGSEAETFNLYHKPQSDVCGVELDTILFENQETIVRLEDWDGKEPVDYEYVSLRNELISTSLVFGNVLDGERPWEILQKEFDLGVYHDCMIGDTIYCNSNMELDLGPLRKIYGIKVGKELRNQIEHEKTVDKYIRM